MTSQGHGWDGPFWVFKRWFAIQNQHLHTEEHHKKEICKKYCIDSKLFVPSPRKTLAIKPRHLEEREPISRSNKTDDMSSGKQNETNTRETFRDSEPQPYLTTKDLKRYYFGSKTYERNEKPKTFKMSTPGRNPKKVRGTATERTKETKKSRETSGSVEDIETDMLVASVQRWSDFYDSL